MRALLIRRVLISVALLVLVSALTFVLLALLPGDAAQIVAGRNATHAQVVQTRKELGLDRPMIEQYGTWLGHAVRGDLGTSMINKQPVASQLDGRLGPTLSLVIAATLLATLMGLLLGVAGARGGPIGRLVDSVAVIGVAVPTFWLGLVLIVIFAVRLGWLPPLGYTSFGTAPAEWAKSLVLPVITLAVPATATIAKQTRDAVSAALAQPFVRTLRAAGVRERSVLFRHALKNAAAPILTVVGLTLIGSLSGAVAVETIFAIPGLGGTAVQATASSDLPLIQGVVIYLTVIVIALNFIVDAAYAYFDPRMRLA